LNAASGIGTFASPILLSNSAGTDGFGLKHRFRRHRHAERRDEHHAERLVNSATVPAAPANAVQFTANASAYRNDNGGWRRRERGGRRDRAARRRCITINGPVNSNNGDVFCGGQRPGMSTIYGAAAKATMPGGGDVTPATGLTAMRRFKSTPGQRGHGQHHHYLFRHGQPDSRRGRRRPSEHPWRTGRRQLVVRTYNDSVNGGKIDLENSNNRRNLNGEVTLEAHFAGDTTVAGVTPASGYAPSDIDYKELLGPGHQGHRHRRRLHRRGRDPEHRPCRAHIQART